MNELNVLTLIIELSLLILLFVALSYAYRFNKQLTLFKEIALTLTKELQQGTIHSTHIEKALENLKKTALNFDQNYTESLEKAQSLRDELDFLLERSESSLTKLEDILRESRETLAQTSETSPFKLHSFRLHELGESEPQDDTQLPPSEVERKLMGALKAVK